MRSKTNVGANLPNNFGGLYMPHPFIDQNKLYKVEVAWTNALADLAYFFGVHMD